ncbi:MAG: transcriptional repressor LexA [Planctomycetes bacterium]|nr:transcriptional repressor LexA [Planctomycetota bacterium]
MFYTERQQAILEFIRRYQRVRTVAPTLEEIAQHFCLSKVTVYEHVRQLEKKGAVRKAPHLARSLEILDPHYKEVPIAHDAARLPLSVLGGIAAGQPLEAVEQEEIFDLGDLMPPGVERYALRVCGDSMIEDGIHDGDLAIIERRSVADDGEVVVAVLDDNEATLKRLYREPQGSAKRYRLEPANRRLSPILVDRVEIRGVVVGLIRRFSH